MLLRELRPQRHRVMGRRQHQAVAGPQTLQRAEDGGVPDRVRNGLHVEFRHLRVVTAAGARLRVGAGVREGVRTARVQFDLRHGVLGGRRGGGAEPDGVRGAPAPAGS